MKGSLTVKELKKYLESMDDNAQILVQTRYGKVHIGLIEETPHRDKHYVILDVVYDR